MLNNSYPSQVWGIRFCKIEEGALLYDPYKLRPLKLNHMGRVLWELSDGMKSFKEIIDILKKKLVINKAEEEFRNEIVSFFNKLVEEGVIELKEKEDK